MFKLNYSKLTGSANKARITGSGSSTFMLPTNYESKLLDDMIGSDNKLTLNSLYREIYLYDNVSGPVVDLMSTLPWSDCIISGITDPAVKRIYEDSLSELNIHALMIQLSVSYLVLGTVIGSLIFNEQKGIFTDLSIHDPDHCNIMPIPLKGYDPKIDLKVSKEMKKFIRSKDPRDREALKEIPNDLYVKLLKNDVIQLEPLNTIYLSRSSVPGINHISYYTRILPIWLIEKALMRGTIIGAWRRQRGITHIQVGTPEWEPTDEQLDAITAMYINADQDPMGAVLTTREGIEIQAGSCLTGDTLIHTVEGLQRLDSFIDHNPNKFKSEIRFDLDYQIKGVDGTFVDTKYWHYRGKNDTIKVISESGSSLSCTENHKILTLDDNGELLLTKAKDSKGKYLCLEVNGLQSDLKLPLGLEMPNIKVNIFNPNKDITIPKYMSPRLAYILGFICSDGQITLKGATVSSTDYKQLETFKVCLKKIFNIDCDIETDNNWIGPHEFEIKGETYTRNKQCHIIKIYSKVFSSCLTQLGLISKENKEGDLQVSYYKQVPWSILQANTKCKYAFIAAYIDGDGSIVPTVSNNETVEVTIYSCSEKILFGFKCLFSDLGYISRTVGRSIRLSACSGSRLYNNIKPYLQCESKKRYECCDIGAQRKFGIPSEAFIPELNARYVRRNRKGGSWFTDDEGNPVLTSKPYEGTFHHHKAATKSYFLYSVYDQGGYKEQLDFIKQVSDTLYNKIMFLFKVRYKFDKVESIIDNGVQHVYDLTMKDKPVFIANGIVVKNSGNDFWRVSDDWDVFTTAKMRALSVNDELLGGNINFSCFTKNTMIPTKEHGIIKIGDIGKYSTDNYKNSKKSINITVPSRYGTANAKVWLDMGKAPILGIKVKSGNKIKCTYTEPILVLKNNETKWVKAKDIKIGDICCLSTNNVTRDTKLELFLPTFEKTTRTINLIDPKKPKYMTPELAYIMGCVASEGYFTKNDIRFYNCDIEYINTFNKCVKHVFGIKCNIYCHREKGSNCFFKDKDVISNKDYYVAIISNKIVRFWLIYLGLEQVDSYNKRVPWSIFQADGESQLAYTAAYIEGDGWISKNGWCIEICSYSKKNLTDMQILLNSHGIISRITPHHKLYFDSYFAKKLYGKIVKFLVSKTLPDVEEGNSDYFGLPSEGIWNFIYSRQVKSVNNPESGRPSITKNGTAFTNDLGEVIFFKTGGINLRNTLLYKSYKNGTYDSVLELLKLLSVDEHDKVLKLIKAKYWFSKVVAIKDLGEDNVYDLSMEKGIEPAFVANGLIVHNTAEVALSSFIENQKAFRDFLTTNIIYNKIFLMLSKYHEIRKVTSAQLDHHIRIEGSKTDLPIPIDNRARIIGQKNLSSSNKYLIPTLHWMKDLSPRMDSAYLDTLISAQDKGVPIPLALMASAAGLNMNNLLDSLAQDIEHRRAISLYKEQLKPPKKAGGSSSEESSEEMDEESEEGMGDEMTGSVAHKNSLPKELVLNQSQVSNLLDLNSRKLSKAESWKAQK